MSDAAAHDATAFWLAHAHPAWMLASIALAALALRAGLRLRATRQRAAVQSDAGDAARTAQPADAAQRAHGAAAALGAHGALRARHIRLGKIAVLAILLGFGGGLASAAWLRGWQILGSAHGLVACIALFLFAATAVLGRHLEQGAGGLVRQRHAAFGLLALFAAAAAFGTGFVLLP